LGVNTWLLHLKVVVTLYECSITINEPKIYQETGVWSINIWPS
jgi:hypothetical protein